MHESNEALLFYNIYLASVIFTKKIEQIITQYFENLKEFYSYDFHKKKELKKFA